MRSPLPMVHLLFGALFVFVALPVARRAWLGTLDEGTYAVMGAVLFLILVGWFVVVQNFRIWWVHPNDARPRPATRHRR